MDKVIRNGNVAVLYSPGFGAGWYTWNTDVEACLFDPEIVALVEQGADAAAIVKVAEKKWNQGKDYFYPGGAEDLEIEWIPEGTAFDVQECDGSESIRTAGMIPTIKA